MDDLDALERAAQALTQARAKGAVIVALYSLTGANVADMPLANFEALPALLAELRRLRRVEEKALARRSAMRHYEALCALPISSIAAKLKEAQARAAEAMSDFEHEIEALAALENTNEP